MTELEKKAAEEATKKTSAKAEKAAEEVVIDDASFDMASFEKATELTLLEFRVKGGKLPAKEAKELEQALEKAYKNKGRKAKKTATYRVAMKTVQLVKGLPTPNSIVNLFSEEAKDKLFF